MPAIHDLIMPLACSYHSNQNDEWACKMLSVQAMLTAAQLAEANKEKEQNGKPKLASRTSSTEVANKACAARVRKREQEMLRSRIRNVKPQVRLATAQCCFSVLHDGCRGVLLAESWQIDTRPPESMALDHVRNNLKRVPCLHRVCFG